MRHVNLNKNGHVRVKENTKRVDNSGDEVDQKANISDS